MSSVEDLITTQTLIVAIVVAIIGTLFLFFGKDQ